MQKNQLVNAIYLSLETLFPRTFRKTLDLLIESQSIAVVKALPMGRLTRLQSTIDGFRNWQAMQHWLLEQTSVKSTALVYHGHKLLAEYVAQDRVEARMLGDLNQEPDPRNYCFCGITLLLHVAAV